MNEVERGREPIYTLGPLNHNPQAVESLEREHGVRPVDRIDEVREGTLAIRTHGVPPSVVARARERGLRVLDATCPFVSKIQRHARELVNDGYRLLIIGERDHPEVRGIQAYSNGKGIIIESLEEANSLRNFSRVGIIIQSTQDAEKVNAIVAALFEKSAEMKVFNTICNATAERQSEVRSLARRVDAMVVVGGYNSGNTSRLAAICREIGVTTHHIETAAEIREEWFHGTRTCGLTAGASTPDASIEEVRALLERIDTGKASARRRSRETVNKGVKG
jgi:4-hydroxy-3-methylbut-2-enyl diphosphate reductase